MKLTPRRLAETAGWMGVAFGAAHVVVSPVGTPVKWGEVLSEGWWNTFTLAPSVTTADLQRAETFWISIGSFGAPMLVLGCYTVWAARNEVRVPGWVGGMLATWGLTLATALPASPGWVIPAMGGLLVWADAQRLRTAPTTSTSTAPTPQCRAAQ
jgi:hypothetical protein